MSFVGQAEVLYFYKTVVAAWSQAIGRNCNSPLLLLPLTGEGFGITSATNMRAKAPWMAWIFALPGVVEKMNIQDMETLMLKCPRFASQPTRLLQAIAQQTDKDGFDVKTLSAALRTDTNKKPLVLHTHRNIANVIVGADMVEQCVIMSQSTTHTGAHLLQTPVREYEADDHVFVVSVARRLRLLHPAVSTPELATARCPKVTATKQVCAVKLNNRHNHCVMCNKGKELCRGTMQ